MGEAEIRAEGLKVNVGTGDLKVYFDIGTCPGTFEQAGFGNAAAKFPYTTFMALRHFVGQD